MNQENQIIPLQGSITTAPNALSINTWEEMERMAKAVAASGLYGMTKPEQAICLFAICQSEGRSPIEALRRYHIIEGKPSIRSDAKQGEFLQKGGGIIWHLRNGDAAAGTFYADRKKMDDTARKRAQERFELMWELEFEKDSAKCNALMVKISKLSVEGEETVLRTFATFQATGLTQDKNGDVKTNWLRWPTEMLTARVATAGINVVMPGLNQGIMTAEEAQDIGQAERVEREQFVAKALTTPNLSDAESIQKIIDQYLDEAKTAAPARKSELQGLAAELRCKLADLSVPETKTVIIEGNAEVLPPEKAQEQAEPAKASKEIPPEKIEEPKQAHEPEVNPDDPDSWMSYKIQGINAPDHKGRELQTFTREQIEILYKKRSIPYMDHRNDQLRNEAIQIKRAFDKWATIPV